MLTLPRIAEIAIASFLLGGCPGGKQGDGEHESADLESTGTDDDSGDDSDSSPISPDDTDNAGHTGVDTGSETDTDTDTDTDVEPDPRTPVAFDLTTVASAKLIGEDEGDTYGDLGYRIQVAGGGDVDADGVPDILVGLSGNTAGGSSQAGATYVVRGPVSGDLDLSLADARLLGSNSEYSGTAVSWAGDVDNDGFDDALVGAPYFRETEDTEGQAYIMMGPLSGDLYLSDADAILHGEVVDDSRTTHSFTGDGVASAGDVNGDGNSDVLVGADGYLAGAAYLVLGPVSGTIELSTDADARILGETAGLLGWGVESAGDTDGDGLDDILIDQPTEPSAITLLFLGPVAGDPTLSDADTTFVGPGDFAGGGNSTSAGDVDGDGHPDVLLSSPGQDEGGTYSGTAYLFLNPSAPELDVASADATLVGVADYTYAGAGLDGAGDMNGDGFADVAVGAPEVGLEGPGTTYILFGPVEGTISLSATDIEIHGEGDDRSGFPVVGAGDMDSDGLDDLLIGGPGDDDGGEDAGAAWLVLAGSLL